MKKFFSVFLVLVTMQFYSFGQVGYGTDVTGNVALPIGKNSNFYNTGFGGLISFYYDITENFRLALMLGYIRVGINGDEINKEFQQSSLSGSIEVTGGLGTIPALLSLRLVSPGPGLRFYGLIEGGIYTYRTSASGKYIIGSQVTPIDKSEFRSEPGVAFGGGILYPFNDELSLDLNIRYHWIQDSEYLNFQFGSSSTVATSQLLTFGAGVNWFFPL